MSGGSNPAVETGNCFSQRIIVCKPLNLKRRFNAQLDQTEFPSLVNWDGGSVSRMAGRSERHTHSDDRLRQLFEGVNEICSRRRVAKDCTEPMKYRGAIEQFK